MEGRLKDLESKVERQTKWNILHLVVMLVINPPLVTVCGILIRTHIMPPPAPTITGGNNVTIGATGPTPRREYFTVNEVAEKEGIAERTVLTWIAAGRLQPAPVKGDRSWIIPADYRIQPQTAALSGMP
jgi:hypothetical protein